MTCRLSGLFFVIASTSALAAPGDGVIATSIFKNGFASVTREFAFKGTTLEVEVPPASLGTLFFMADDGSTVTVEAIPGGKGTRRIPLQSMGDLLRANVGKHVFLRVMDSGVMEGDLRAVGGEVVTLKMADGPHVLPIGRVTEIASTKDDLRLEVDVAASDAPRTYRVTKSKVGGRLRMTSLEPGLSWVPSYRIDLSDPKTATVIANSTIFNDDYDLKDVRARLVTGYPAARYRNVADPLVSRLALPDFLAAVASPDNQPPLRRDLATAPAQNPYGGPSFITYDPNDNSVIVGAGYGRNQYSSGGFGGGMGGSGGGRDYDGIQNGGGAGESLGELFFYETPPLTIAKGVRRMENLFRFEAPYRHINTFEIGPEYDENLNPIRQNQSDNFEASLARYYRGQANEDDQRVLREAIWHEVEFENRAGQPLTGAVGTIVDGGEMVGQGLVAYTPNGGKSLLRLDRALDLIVDRKEELILREPAAVKSNWNSYSYDRITMKGVIKIRNPRQTPVVVRGRKRTFGEMTSATPGGKFTLTSPLVRGVNGSSVAEWEMTIAPGATATLEYTYLLLTTR